MPLTSDAAIDHLARRFLDRTLPKPEWTHAAHWAAALWLLRHRPDLATPEAMRPLIIAYNEATGTTNSDAEGYHHTITVASLRAAAHGLAAAPADAPLAVVLASLLASPLGRPDWLLASWAHETLFSVAARRGWVEQDLAPLAL